MNTSLLVVVLGIFVAFGCGGGATPGVGANVDLAPTEDVLADAEDLDTGSAMGGDAVWDGWSETGDEWGAGGEVQPGMPGWPCEDGKECYSGFCIETPDGYRCTRLCTSESECEPG